ncbi:MAG: response regulator, partial [Bdellovibrionales bacterium]|nr:response regulator [Bdellovibrionales bacterium]
SDLTADECPKIEFLDQSKQYIKLTVSDNGMGISQSILSDIFTPFFTTKPTGKGTGLGLSMVYGIVKGLNGHITVDSKENEGTNFTIYIPSLAEVKNESLSGKENSSVPFQSNFLLNKNILIAEDDQETLSFLKDFISLFQGQTLCASSRGEEIKLFNEHKGSIDLIISDISIPLKDSLSDYSQIQAVSPGLPIIFLVDPEDQLQKDGNFKNLPYAYFITKPIDSQQLLRSLASYFRNPSEHKAVA